MFLELVSVTLTKPADRTTLLVALDEQRLNRGQRPEPTTTIGWAAYYLRRHAWHPDRDGELDERVEAGKR